MALLSRAAMLRRPDQRPEKIVPATRDGKAGEVHHEKPNGAATTNFRPSPPFRREWLFHTHGGFRASPRRGASAVPSLSEAGSSPVKG